MVVALNNLATHSLFLDTLVALGNDIEVALLTEFNYATSSLSGQFVGAFAQSTAVANSSGGTGNDEIHILVKDKTGKVSGKAGTILERFHSCL